MYSKYRSGASYRGMRPKRNNGMWVALIILLAATFFTGAMTWNAAALCVVNAVVVSLAANGAFDAVNNGRK